MSTHRLLLTNRAIADLRKMPEPLFSDARLLLDRLQAAPEQYSVSIRGVKGLYRAKHNSKVRVAWTWCTVRGGSPVPLVGSVVRRSDTTYGPNGPFSRPIREPRSETEWDALEQERRLDDPDEILQAPEATPAFWYDGGASFKQYVYRTFARNARLTDAQEDDYIRYLHRADSDVLILQGGAGSGKSTFALVSACRMASPEGGDRHVTFLAPPALVAEFSAYSEVKATFGSTPHAGSVTTVEQWLIGQAPGTPVPDRAAARAALQEAANQVRKSGRRAPQDISDDDVLLMEAFVLADASHKNEAASAPYAQRVAALRNIPPESWGAALTRRGTSSRTVLAKAVLAAKTRPPSSQVLLVVDEAQDLLLVELEAIVATWMRWKETGCSVVLWLLGDLNQRITPSGFTWDALARLGVRATPQPVERNYRNTRAILRTADAYHDRARTLVASHGDRHAFQTSQPGDDTPDGEHVRYAVFADEAAVDRAIRDLAAAGAPDRERSLRASLSQRIQVLAPAPRLDVGGALVHSPVTIKGSELEAAILVGAFDLPDHLHAVNGGYTLVTRVRSRLLLLLTNNDLPAARDLGVLRGADPTTVADSAAWISEWGSLVDLAGDADRTLSQLKDGSPLGTPWLDTWEILTEIDRGGHAAEIEEAFAHLDASAWRQTLAEADCGWLRSLALRSLGQHAAAEAALLAWEQTEPLSAESARQWQRLADALKQARRPYEAHRLLFRRLTGYAAPEGTPFPDASPHGSLRDAVVSATLLRLRTMTPTPHV